VPLRLNKKQIILAAIAIALVAAAPFAPGLFWKGPLGALSTGEVRHIQNRDGKFDDVLKATGERAHRKAKAQAATSAQLRVIAEDLAKSLRSAPPDDRDRLLRHLGKITVVNDCGGQAEMAMR
jgi:hypothetical protein